MKNDNSNIYKSTIFRGISLNYLHLLLTGVSLIVLTPIMLEYLGKSGYGLWSAFIGVIGYFGLLNFGFQTATAKYTAEYTALKNFDYLSKIISTILVLFIFISLIISLFTVGFSSYVVSLLNAPSDLVWQGKIAFILLGLAVAVRISGSVVGNVIYGHERVALLKGFGIIQIASNFTLTVIFLMTGLGLIGVGLAFLTSLIILTFLYVIHLNRANYIEKINPKLYSYTTLKEIAPYSLRSFILNLTSRILYQTDNIVIAIFKGPASVSSYAVAYNLMFNMTYLASVISETIFPRFSSLYALQDRNTLRSIFLETTKLSAGIGSIIALFLLLEGTHFLNLWVGESNTVDNVTLTMFALMSIIHTAFTPAGLMLQGIGENKGFTISESINAILNIILSIILIMNYGVWGVAAATLISHIITSTWVVPLLASKHIGLPITEYIAQGIAKPTLLILPTLLTRQLLNTILPMANIFAEIAVSFCTIAFIYVPLFYIFALTNQERIKYKEYVSTLIKK